MLSVPLARSCEHMIEIHFLSLLFLNAATGTETVTARYARPSRASERRAFKRLANDREFPCWYFALLQLADYVPGAVPPESQTLEFDV